MGRYAGVIARRDEQVVLVREQYEQWERPFWSLPSGAVEPEETPAVGASRELAEESGLVIEPGRLTLISHVAVTDGAATRSESWNFTVEVDTVDLEPHDPDGSIVEARWFPVGQALEHLDQHPYPPIREPALAYLRGELSPGAEWTFLWHDGRRPPDQFSWTAPRRSQPHHSGGHMHATAVFLDLPFDGSQATREFYTDFLGLSDETLSLGWATRLGTPDGKVRLQLITKDQTAPVNPIASIGVDDVDAAYAQAVERGYEIVHPLTDEPWGIRRFFVRTPDGNVLNINTHRD